MNQREWYYWHIIRHFGPMTNEQLWDLLWGGDSDYYYGFHPTDPSPTTLGMVRKGLLENTNPLGNHKGVVPMWVAI